MGAKGLPKEGSMSWRPCCLPSALPLSSGGTRTRPSAVQPDTVHSWTPSVSGRYCLVTALTKMGIEGRQEAGL